MNLTDLTQRYPQIVAAIAGAILIVSLVIAFRPRDRQVPEAYFMDIASGELFAGNGAGAGVLAHVYSCGACDQPAMHKVGYLVKYTGPKDDPANMMVASPKARGEWVSIMSAQGTAIVESVSALRVACPEGFTECLP